MKKLKYFVALLILWLTCFAGYWSSADWTWYVWEGDEIGWLPDSETTMAGKSIISGLVASTVSVIVTLFALLCAFVVNDLRSNGV